MERMDSGSQEGVSSRGAASTELFLFSIDGTFQQISIHTRNKTQQTNGVSPIPTTVPPSPPEQVATKQTQAVAHYFQAPFIACVRRREKQESLLLWILTHADWKWDICGWRLEAAGGRDAALVQPGAPPPPLR